MKPRVRYGYVRLPRTVDTGPVDVRVRKTCTYCGARFTSAHHRVICVDHVPQTEETRRAMRRAGA